MIDPQLWMPEVLGKMQALFGQRLLYLGLQGSYRRGEATEKSDIDLVVILDRVELDDLDAYRETIRSLPEGEKACGFIGGRSEIRCWPKHELFTLKMDTADWYGKLDDYVAEAEKDDVVASVKIGVSALYHMLAHSYLYAGAGERPAILESVCKNGYFVLQAAHYLRSGVYFVTKKSLHAHLQGDDQEVMTASLDFANWHAAKGEKAAWRFLLCWIQKVLAETF